MGADTNVLELAERALSFLSLLGAAGLALHLHRQGLRQIYPYFFAYLLADVLRAVVLLSIRPYRTIYAYGYVASVPVMCVFYFLIVWELCSLVLRNHPGIARAGKRAMLIMMAVALVLVVVSLQTDLSNPKQAFPTLLTVHTIERAVLSTLGLFLILMASLLVWFPIPLNRNTVYYCFGYTTLLCSKAAFLLTRNVFGPEIVKYPSLAILVVANVCILFWLLKLSRAGEHLSKVVRQPTSEGEAERLLLQLDAINRTLSRVAEKR